MNLVGARVPSATYRLQFHSGFTFRDAQALLDYLDELGISDVYSSPYFQASPESTHGYDVANHNRLNPAIGDTSDYRAFTNALRQHGMGQILDFVPNHMGIGLSLNTWWMSVLEEGIRSPYAHYFDIDWQSGREALADRVLLPILGDRYGMVLEEGEFKLRFGNGGFFLDYHETCLPLSPRSYSVILESLAGRVDENSAREIKEIIRFFTEDRPLTEKKSALHHLVQSNPGIRKALDETLGILQGEKGCPASFDALHDLIEAQAYRLSYWRTAAEEINYRRFFDINTLAAIRVEIPEVFAAAHQLVFELLARGDVTGLRIDHIDGLWNPKAYLTQLQECHARLCPGGTLYLVVEKILDPDNEQLRCDWPVHGTTGYEFANQAASLFVNPRAARHFTKTYEKFAGTARSFSDLVYEKKKQTLLTALSSELTALGRMLDELSEMHRHFRDFTRKTLTSVVSEALACFPVYRSYCTGDSPPSPEDEKVILRAIHAARRRNPAIEKVVFDFLRGVLLLRLPDHLTPEQREAHVRFVMKFQQCSGPVTAKGVEDTAFYIYNRLVALNEVGGNPGVFGGDSGNFHRLCGERCEHFPHTLLATSTHDTKRSEDVRMRLAALSEMPVEWRNAVQRWSKLNNKLRQKIEEEFAPSRNEEYLLYQTLVGSWPLDPADQPGYATRIKEYMTKALKEAKINSSWTEPNEEWENAVMQFVDCLFDDSRSAAFLADLSQFVERIAPLGALNSLAQIVLKCTAPGVPDFYQGMEIWDFSLVDPDNRRPVDYAKRRALLSSLHDVNPDELLAGWKTGRIKLYIIRQLLHLRRQNPDFFRNANYHPLPLFGSRADNIVSFRRSWNGRQLLVAVPRLTAHLGSSFPTGAAWDDTRLSPDAAIAGKNIFTGASLSSLPRIADLLAEFPVAVIWLGEHDSSPVC